jgi:hypothetical protein
MITGHLTAPAIEVPVFVPLSARVLVTPCGLGLKRPFIPCLVLGDAEGFCLTRCCAAYRRQLLTTAQMTAVLAAVPVIGPAAVVTDRDGRLAAGPCDRRRTA